MRRAIPPAAYDCKVCRSRCRCHDLVQAECPTASKASCAGGCGRTTTPAESCKPGFCRACAHEPEPSKQLAWRVKAELQVEGGWRPTESKVLSYTDAKALGWKLERDGLRKVKLVEVPVRRRPATQRRPAHKVMHVDRSQLDMFAKRKSRR